MNPIRIAVPDDLPRLVAMYNQAIESRRAAADLEPFTEASRRAWFDEHAPEMDPIFVSDDGIVRGYLSPSPYRGLPALRRTAEISYYVDSARHGRGIGSALMERAAAEAPQRGRKILLAIVFTDNAARIRLLEKFRFARRGFLPGVAEAGGRLHGQLNYGRNV